MLAKKSVLVVDDDEDIRMNIAYALEAEGYTVLKAENGEQAVELLVSLSQKRNLPGCILLDLMMPVMDGNEFLAHIYGEYFSVLGNIPIIIATAKGSPIRPDSLSSKMERIKKPMELSELYSVVNRYCSIRE